MSDESTALIALYFALLVSGGCLAAQSMRRLGYDPGKGQRSGLHKIIYADARPNAGSRLLVNLTFWGSLFVLLSLAGSLPRITALAVEGSGPLRSGKFVEYADGELWLLQILAGALAFLVILLSRAVKRFAKWPMVSLTTSRRFVLDDFWGVALNFGSLFIISGLIQAFEGKLHFLTSLALGSVNVLVYAMFSNLGEDEDASPTCSHADARATEISTARPKDAPTETSHSKTHDTPDV